jgi:hypothetical protein
MKASELREKSAQELNEELLKLRKEESQWSVGSTSSAARIASRHCADQDGDPGEEQWLKLRVRQTS